MVVSSPPRSKKELELLLERAPTFSNPVRELEQYVTPSDIASELLWSAYMLGLIKDKKVVDLGCGTCRLAYGAALLGASQIICVDIDREALKIGRDFMAYEVPNTLVEYVEADIRSTLPLRNVNDCTVVMNPPFGVWSRGADMEFLQAAISMCKNVFSIHKKSQGLQERLKAVAREYNIIANRKMRLGMSYSTHKRRSYYVDVLLIMFNSD
jgi:putative methylase